jgi:hypothetical protein
VGTVRAIALQRPQLHRSARLESPLLVAARNRKQVDQMQRVLCGRCEQP